MIMMGKICMPLQVSVFDYDDDKDDVKFNFLLAINWSLLTAHVLTNKNCSFVVGVS
jgi:hypothetical protein